MGGILGGSQSSSVKLPSYIEQASQNALQQAQQVGNVGYTPYMGPTVAAMTPAQNAAFDANNAGLAAFGLHTAQNAMGPATDYGSVQGYSDFPIYQQALEAFKAANPAQYAAIAGMVMDPVTGQPMAQPAMGAPMQQRRSGGGSSRSPVAVQGRQGGYTGLLDMINGGGAGSSGRTFQGGGLLSNIANRITVPRGSR